MRWGRKNPDVLVLCIQCQLCAGGEKNLMRSFCASSVSNRYWQHAPGVPPGMGHQVADNAEPHRLSTVAGGTLFSVD